MDFASLDSGCDAVLIADERWVSFVHAEPGAQGYICKASLDDFSNGRSDDALCHAMLRDRVTVFCPP